MNILNSILELDLSLLEWSRTLIAPTYGPIVQISGELVVIYGAVLLVALWLYGLYIQDIEYKKTALKIFWTIISVYIVYAVVNLAIPQWRPGAMEAVEGIAPLIPHPTDNSFPSGHALFVGALLVGVWRYMYQGWLIMTIIILGTITLTARVIGGVHYPGDIVAGLVIGILGAWLLCPLVTLIDTTLSPVCIRIAKWIKL